MVRHAFSILAPDIATRLICFSDDMDGLRKVPENVPNADLLAEHLEKPLTAIPDPFGTHDSFGAHNNARLRAFLDSFGFDYEFMSATQMYRSGAFDRPLAILENYQPCWTLFCRHWAKPAARPIPVLPLCPQTGRVLMVPVRAPGCERRHVAYTHPDTGVGNDNTGDGRRVQTAVEG
ncbi:MAG: hypothetical protein CM15mP21_5230 [Hyphomicrobiales bacterium]|nr:MAG: hypothetical protein CM15mP21_5230 [Hyphomicrobiales bacterium]